MKLSENDKKLIEKLAKIMNCKWFEFAVDDYGETCVINNITNKKYKLLDGLYKLEGYNSDVMSLISTHCKTEFIQDEAGNIKLYNLMSEEEKDLNIALEELASRYPTIEQLNNLFSTEEKERCEQIFSEVIKQQTLTREKLESALSKAINIIEKDRHSTLFTGNYNKELGITKYAYTLLKDVENNSQT